MGFDSKRLPSLLEEHGAELYALLTRLTLRADAAEDLLQELFLRLRNSDGLARADNPKAYLFRTAIHLAFDWRRARRPPEPLTTEPAVGGESPLDRLIGAEELEQILVAMQRLSELGREVLVLHYLQHQEYPEIARQLGKTEHQVRGICSKALGQLRAAFQPAADEPDKQGSEP